MNDPRFAKLPAWARIEIHALESDVARWKAIAEGALSPSVASNVCLRTYVGKGRTEIPLPNDARILFTLDNGGEIEVHHERGHGEPGTLTIRTENSPLRVAPTASNTVQIECPNPHNIRKAPR